MLFAVRAKATPYHAGMVDLSFDDLRLFARVAALGTLSAVARERNVPVSQISRRLQRIESAYQTRLIHRTTQGLSLTPEGQSLLAYAERILSEVDALEGEFSQAGDQVSGLVKVSMSSVIAQHLLVESLPSLHAKHPLLQIDFRVDDALIDMAREGIDIAIRTGEPQSDTLVMRQLGMLHRRFYASPAYLKQHGIPEHPDALSQHQLIGNSQHAHLNQWLFDGARMVFAKGSFSSDNTATIASMAIAGLGIARIASVVAEPLVAQGKLVRVCGTWQTDEPVSLSAFMLSNRHRLPKVRACLDHWVHWLNDATAQKSL